jgi:hypothetical protein
MQLRTLNAQALTALYQTELVRAFPPTELKPLKSMLTLMEQGRYEALGMYDEDGLHGYALFWLEPGIPFALLDYFGTLEGQRGSGLGTKMLDLLAEHYRNYRGIFGEAEGVFSPDPEEAKLLAAAPKAARDAALDAVDAVIIQIVDVARKQEEVQPTYEALKLAREGMKWAEKPATEPATETTPTTGDDFEEVGCEGVIGATAVVITAVLGLGVTVLGKKH